MILWHAARNNQTSNLNPLIFRPLFSTIVKPAQTSETNQILPEFETYISEPIVTFSGSTFWSYSPLSYWREHKGRFPGLSTVAKEVFCIPASSGNIERLFSTATDIAAGKGNRTKGDLMENFVFINRNRHVMV